MSPRARKPYARARWSPIAEAPRVAEHRELGDVAAEEERGRPVGYNAQLPREQGQLVEVVAAGHEPADEAGEPCTGDVGDSLVPAERGALAEHPVAVGANLPCDVLREPACLPQGVLRRRRVELPGRG